MMTQVFSHLKLVPSPIYRTEPPPQKIGGIAKSYRSNPNCKNMNWLWTGATIPTIPEWILQEFLKQKLWKTSWESAQKSISAPSASAAPNPVPHTGYKQSNANSAVQHRLEQLMQQLLNYPLGPIKQGICVATEGRGHISEVEHYYSYICGGLFAYPGGLTTQLVPESIITQNPCYKWGINSWTKS